MLASLLILSLTIQVPDTGQPSLLAAIARIRVGSIVRVDARSAGRHVGPLRASGQETISLGEPDVAVPIAGIDSLWVRGAAAGTGAAAGAIVGGLGLGAIALALASAFNEGGSCEDCGSVAVLGALAGAAGGALVGALIGSMFPKWHRRFP